jgi:hypothetical protein
VSVLTRDQVFLELTPDDVFRELDLEQRTLEAVHSDVGEIKRLLATGAAQKDWPGKVGSETVTSETAVTSHRVTVIFLALTIVSVVGSLSLNLTGTGTHQLPDALSAVGLVCVAVAYWLGLGRSTARS